jgi:ribosomal protein S18 acetylase RimI-like enzyme
MIQKEQISLCLEDLNEVRKKLIKLEKKHIKPVGLMLSRAFKDEMKDVFPNEEERRKKEPYVEELYVRRSYSSSQGYITSPNIEGVAIWRHSVNKVDNSFWNLLTSGSLWLMIKIGWRAIKKIDAFDQYMEKKHKELAPMEHWYLAALAVDPGHQGKGHASRLLRDMFFKFDEQGLPCYLETDGEKNVSMYKRFGFKVVDEYVVPNTKDKLIAMLREPKGGKK